MKIARDRAELAQMLPLAQREAEAFFGNGEVYLEHYLERPRHIEVQILGDGQGGVVHLGERDCSLQRSHQKIVEETPSPALNPEERDRIGALAVGAMRELGYRSAGTLEFLYQDGEFLLHRDEYAPPSRASDQRNGQRRRYRTRAVAHCRWRAARLSAGRDPSFRPRHRVPDQRREPARFSPVAGTRHRLPRAGRSRCARRQRALSGLCRAAFLRQPDLEADHPRPDPQRMPDAPAPGIGGIRDRRHRDDDPAASAAARHPRIHRRRLRHPLARALCRTRWDEVAQDPADLRNSARRLCRGCLSDGRIGG